MTNPLQEQVNSIRQSIMEDLHKGQSKVYEGLVLNMTVNRLPENIFRDYFLAGFMGNHPNPNWVGEWISVAGTPSAEVAIIDIAGNEIFRVPPMIASMSLLLQGKTKGRINDVFTHMGNIKQNSPMQAVTFATQALGEKARELSPSVGSDFGQRWAAIFRRYGVLKPASTTAPNMSHQAAEEDLFDFS